MSSLETFGQDLLQDLRAAWARADLPSRPAFVLHLSDLYYGLTDGSGRTLEQVGQDPKVHLTRERVRQLIDAGVQAVRAGERTPARDVQVKTLDQDRPKPYARSAAWVNHLRTLQKTPFLPMDRLWEVPYFEAFKANPKGLIAILNDAGVRQVMYRGHHYLYRQGESRQRIVDAVQRYNKQIRRASTVQKMLAMAKTVTWVPDDVRQRLRIEAAHRDWHLNRLYEKILLAFVNTLSPHTAFDGPRPGFQEGRSRADKTTDVQMGIYIRKTIAERIKQEAKSANVSFMSYLRHAFVWFVVDLSDSQRQKVMDLATNDSMTSSTSLSVG